MSYSSTVVSGLSKWIIHEHRGGAVWTRALVCTSGTTLGTNKTAFTSRAWKHCMASLGESRLARTTVTHCLTSPWFAVYFTAFTNTSGIAEWANTWPIACHVTVVFGTFRITSLGITIHVWTVLFATESTLIGLQGTEKISCYILWIMNISLRFFRSDMLS